MQNLYLRQQLKNINSKIDKIIKDKPAAVENADNSSQPITYEEKEKIF
jgi:hypothetical protein